MSFHKVQCPKVGAYSTFSKPPYLPMLCLLNAPHLPRSSSSISLVPPWLNNIHLVALLDHHSKRHAVETSLLDIRVVKDLRWFQPTPGRKMTAPSSLFLPYELSLIRQWRSISMANCLRFLTNAQHTLVTQLFSSAKDVSLCWFYRFKVQMNRLMETSYPNYVNIEERIWQWHTSRVLPY
jgi:hypothetical protein